MTNSYKKGRARFETVREIGRGGMASVQLVYDTERGERVALKRVQDPGPAALLRLKREFRVVERLLHPALIRVHELGQDANGLYYTMELIAGVDLFSWCHRIEPKEQSLSSEAVTLAPTRSSAATLGTAQETIQINDLPEQGLSYAAVPRATLATLDMARLSHLLPQLFEGLQALHAQGIVHRDLKPANVLVRDDGQVKILDFGILAELDKPQDQEVVGTPGYMAPEQIQGALPTPACDLYALGIILFQLVAGRLPFKGSARQVMKATISVPPASLATLIPDTPPWLASLCDALLQKEPQARPTLAELAEQLRKELPVAPRLPPQDNEYRLELIGREGLMASLDAELARAFSGRTGGVVLEGPTGVGKSAIATELAQLAGASGRWVLQGQGRAADRVPFNVLDGVLDNLATQFRPERLEQPALREALSCVAKGFPVLGRVLPGWTPSKGGLSRRVLFDAVANVFSILAADGGLLLWIEDLQWADMDSLALLEHILFVRSSGVACLTTIRDDVGESSAKAWLAERGELLRYVVPPLGDYALREIVERVAGGDVDQSKIDEAIAACDGCPFLAEVAGRVLGRELGDARTPLDVLVSEAVRDAPELLALLSAANDRIAVPELASMLEMSPGPVDDLVGELERRGVLRTGGRAGVGRRVEFYHNAVKQEAARALGPDVLRSAHQVFLKRLRSVESPSHLKLVRHLAGSSQIGEAARFAPQAAEEAAAQGAFGLAAEMIELALDNAVGEQNTLLLQRARYLRDAARYAEAADCFALAAEHQTNKRAQADMRVSEAECLLAAQRIPEGYQRLDEAMALRGNGTQRLGKASLSKLLAGVRFLLGPPRPRAPRGSMSVEVARQEVRVGLLLSYFDPLEGIRFLQNSAAILQHAELREEAAWCHFFLAVMANFARAKAGPAPLGERYAAAARRILGDTEIKDVTLRALPVLLHGYELLRVGKFAESEARMAQALRILEDAGRNGTFEHLAIMGVWANLSLVRQNVPALIDAAERFGRASRNSPDSSALVHLAGLQTICHLFRGKIPQARAQVEALKTTWPAEPATFQRTLAATYDACVAPLDHRAPEAWRSLLEILQRDRNFRPLSSLYGPWIRAQLSLCMVIAHRQGDRGAKLGTVRRWAAGAMGAVPVLHGAAYRARAYAEDSTGSPQKALRWLEKAEAEAKRWGYPIDGAVARYQRGRRVGGDEGAKLRAEARAMIHSTGASTILLDEDPA